MLPHRYGRVRRRAALLFLLLLFVLSSACRREGERCLSCHGGIEPVSGSHHGCATCHGGDRSASEKEAAHAGMRGGGNPSAPEVWSEGCGGCHRYQLERVRSTVMTTNAGLIGNIQLTWEGSDGRSYAALPDAGSKAGGGGAGEVEGPRYYDPGGAPKKFAPVAELDHLSGELYRKFCSRCHVGAKNAESYAAAHAAGCAACHFPYNDEGSYRGKDRSVAGQGGRAETHAIDPLPKTAVCTRCHSRSGRIGYSFQGLYDGNGAQVPTVNGEPGAVAASGGRNLVHIEPDVHQAAGLECIDCHTSRDVMGDGFAYPTMYLQTEIACEDCHGGPNALPRYRAIERENDEALRESRRYPRPARLGDRMIQTSKGRSYSNVFVADGAIWLQGKRSGRLHRTPVITGGAEHTVVGHRRLACHACHSRTVIQCYGCHTAYDKGKKGMDFVRGEETPGAFDETEDYRKLYPFPLALDQRGRISPVTPGCQTFVTVIEPDGSVSRREEVARFQGKRQLRFAPLYSHNTGKRAITCTRCHGNPQFLGFGQHVVEGGTLRPTLICEKSERKPLDGFLAMENGRVGAFAAVTRKGSRPLNGAEVKRVLGVNLCLPCHVKADDPVYRKGLNHDQLKDPRHRRLLRR